MPGPSLPRYTSDKRIRKPVEKYDPAIPMTKKRTSNPLKKDGISTESDSPQEPSNVPLPNDSPAETTAMNPASAPETRRELELDGVFRKTYDRFSTIVSVHETYVTNTDLLNAVAGTSTSTPVSSIQSKATRPIQPRFRIWT